MNTLKTLILGALALGPQAAPAAETTYKAPNVLVILADDSGWGDYRFNGNSQLDTPHLDSLANTGTRLDRFFVCAVCAPTRAEFLTGRYHSRGGVRGVSTGLERLNIDEKTIADSFRASGYATGAFGKWHNGSQWPYHPNARGFDQYYGFTSGHWGEYFDPPLEMNGVPVRGTGYVADDFTSKAIEFIEHAKDRPFFCYLTFNTPHSPWTVPDAYWQRFHNKPITLRGSEPARENMDQTRCALAMMENLDWNVGRILGRLNDLQATDDTIVVYFSDNGPNTWRWNGGMKGIKGSTDEGGLRSVCLIRWPAGGVRAGAVVPQIAGAIDLLPTLTSLAGIQPIPARPLDGRDLSPLLRGQEIDWPDRLIFSHQNGNVSVRSQQYRLDQRGALFDMTSDGGQTTDISAGNEEAASRLRTAVSRWRDEVLPKGKDERPFPVGFRAFTRTPLPARDGLPHGSIQRSSAAPNCSYFVNWKRLDDRITWDIAVETSGNYEVEVLYTCPIADAGSTVQLEFNGSTLAGRVTPGWDPPLYTHQDTIERPKGESQMKPFRSLPLGVIRLARGRGELTLRAVDIPGSSVMDVRQINLTLQ